MCVKTRNVGAVEDQCYRHVQPVEAVHINMRTPARAHVPNLTRDPQPQSPNRAVLAEAVFRSMLATSPQGLQDQIFVESASIGPCFGDGYDSRVEAAAAAARLPLPPRVCRVFDEASDIVDFDLVLVMDQFDYAEVGVSLCVCGGCLCVLGRPGRGVQSVLCVS